jgi:hypothetical protein
MSTLLGLPVLGVWPGGASPSVANFTQNATTDFSEFIFQAVDATAISSLGFRQGTLTGTAPVYRVSLQGVDASGNPDGSIKASGNAYFDYTPTGGNNNTWQWVTLGTSYTPTRGELLAMVIAYQSGTIDGSNNCSFGSTSAVLPASSTPYAIQNDAGSRTRQAGSPLFGWATASLAYGLPAVSAAATTFNSGSTPDERALLLTVPTTFCASYKIAGAFIYGIVTAGSTFDLVLYDTDGTTVLQTTTFDADASIAVSARGRQLLFDTTTLATLTAGSTYRLSLKPGASNSSIVSLVVANASDLDAYPFGAAWAQGSSRTDGGAWADSNLQRYGINPILADVTAPSGGGGGMLFIPNLAGT